MMVFCAVAWVTLADRYGRGEIASEKSGERPAKLG